MSHETNHNILDQIEHDQRLSKALRRLDSKQDDDVKNPLKAFIKTLNLDNPSETRELEDADVETKKLKHYYDTIAFVGIFMIPEAVRCGGSSQAADEIENELIKTAKKAAPHLNRETEEFYRNTFRALVEKLADEEFLPTFFRAHNIEKTHIYSGATVLDDALVTMDAAYEYGGWMGTLSASNALITIRRIAAGQNTIPYLIPPDIESDEEMAEYMERAEALIKQDQTGRLYLHEQLKWLEEKYREAVELLGTEGSYLDKYEREAVKIGFTYPSFLLATKLYDEAAESYFNKKKSSAEQIT